MQAAVINGRVTIRIKGETAPAARVRSGQPQTLLITHTPTDSDSDRCAHTVDTVRLIIYTAIAGLAAWSVTLMCAQFAAIDRCAALAVSLTH